MAKLAAALAEAADLAPQDDKTFGEGFSGILTKLVRSSAAVRKTPELLEKEVPADGRALDAWTFLLRVASANPAYAKQAWAVAAALAESPSWVAAFAPLERKHRMGLSRAGTRDAVQVSGIVIRLIAAGAAELNDVLPADDPADPAVCLAVLHGLESPDVPADRSEAALASEAGATLAERARQAAEGNAEEKRRAVPGSGKKKAYGAADNIPVFVCEGISGSHQTMEIKRGL